MDEDEEDVGEDVGMDKGIGTGAGWNLMSYPCAQQSMQV
jgi:hypothetical protein